MQYAQQPAAYTTEQLTYAQQPMVQYAQPTEQIASYTPAPAVAYEQPMTYAQPAPAYTTEQMPSYTPAPQMQTTYAQPVSYLPSAQSMVAIPSQYGAQYGAYGNLQSAPSMIASPF